MNSIINRIFSQFNLEIRKIRKSRPLPSDFEPLHQQIYKKVSPFTMTGPERIYSLVEAVKYVERNQIKGDIVECGVWKGGSMMAVAETLIQAKSFDRNLYLYDTFEGMPPPSTEDKNYAGQEATELLNKNLNKEENLTWAHSTLEEVQRNMHSTGYPKEKIFFIRGKVEETIPGNTPLEIALLRLDTDWYESTYHELLHLYPLLKSSGVLILDDYGYWQGARKATDEYFEKKAIRAFLSRIDETGRIVIKQDP